MHGTPGSVSVSPLDPVYAKSSGMDGSKLGREARERDGATPLRVLGHEGLGKHVVARAREAIAAHAYTPM